MPILFSPENVLNVLVKLPSVAASLPDPALEGEPSDAFPGVLAVETRRALRARAAEQQLLVAAYHPGRHGCVRGDGAAFRLVDAPT